MRGLVTIVIAGTVAAAPASAVTVVSINGVVSPAGMTWTWWSPAGSGAYSVAAPKARPWTTRTKTSRAGASRPTC